MPGVSQAIKDAMLKAGLVSSASEISSSRGERVSRKSDGALFFVKEGTNVAQMKGEAASLRAMYDACPGICPRVYACEEQDGKAVMISDYFDLTGSSSASQKILGRRMATEMHDPKGKGRSPNGKFGFDCPTHCGPTEQPNSWEDDWLTFFRDRRLRFLIDILGKRDAETSRLGKDILDRVCPLLLQNFEPAPVPVIVHGDLWSGNVSAIAGGEPVIYDPSSCYGHGEFDWGIARMFGGLSIAEKAYFEVIPRSQPHNEQRMQIYQLYHTLNHAHLFGSSYLRGAKSIMKELSAWADTQSKL